MKKTFLIMMAAGLLVAQTGPRVGQIRAPESGEIIVRVGPGPFNLHMANLGPGFTLDTSGSPYVLRLSAVPAVKDRTAYELAAPTAEFTVPVSFVPGSLEIHRGGLLMTEPFDYTVTGQTIAFVPSQIPQVGDVVSLEYFPAPL